MLLAIGVFLVRFRDRFNRMFYDLIETIGVLEESPSAPIVPVDSDVDRFKTWDEKYEEEIEAISKRLRQNSGLADLPSPVLSWGEPPAVNLKNQEGLSIKDVTKSPMNANRIDLQ